MEKIKTLYRNDHEEHSSQGQPQTFPAMATTNFPQSDTLQVTPTNHSESVALQVKSHYLVKSPRIVLYIGFS
jgi:hypothetical protein